ncbi:MAG: hypothetical protein ACRDJF_09420 [Actinomycetota bacterium]
MERRALLLLMGVAGGAATAGALLPSGIWNHTHDRGAGTHDDLGIEEIALITGQYRKLEAATPSQALRDPALAHLHFVSSRLGQQVDADAERLAAEASVAAGFAGWLALDMNDHAAARRHYESAIEYAERARSDMLRAYMAGSMSLWASAAGNSNEALRLIGQARSLIPREAPPAVQAWVAALSATAHASIRDIPASLDALGRAETAAGQVGAGDEPLWPWIFSFDRAKLALYRGACATRLKLPKIALPALHEALEARGSTTPKRRALVLCDVAECHVLAGEIEEACRRTAEAFTIGVRKGSGRAVQRVREVRAQLAPWKTTPAVRDLEDHLLGTLFPSS